MRSRRSAFLMNFACSRKANLAAVAGGRGAVFHRPKSPSRVFLREGIGPVIERPTRRVSGATAGRETHVFPGNPASTTEHKKHYRTLVYRSIGRKPGSCRPRSLENQEIVADSFKCPGPTSEPCSVVRASPRAAGEARKKSPPKRSGSQCAETWQRKSVREKIRISAPRRGRIFSAVRQGGQAG